MLLTRAVARLLAEYPDVRAIGELAVHRHTCEMSPDDQHRVHHGFTSYRRRQRVGKGGGKPAPYGST
jgi:hypothetical protein